MTVDSKRKSHGSHRTMLLFFVSLLLVILTVSTVFYVLTIENDNSSSMETTAAIPPILENVTYVTNETELRQVLNDAVGTSVIIVPTADIYLTDSALHIPDKTNVTLTNDNTSDVCKIFGALNNNTIVVEDGAVLILNSITITHNTNAKEGTGLIVNPNGTVIMYGGEISGNNAKNGGGVYNRGTFKMYGGKISNNKASNNGGGLYNAGDFEMYGGEISSNNATNGGGVYNRGTFNRLGGIISNNKATSRGYNWA